MFEPKKDSPRRLLVIYPYLVFLRSDRKMFFRALTGQVRFSWHYSWEAEQPENNSVDHPDFRYEPGSFIRYEPEDPMMAEGYRRNKKR
jgi:hypothetical protein